MSIILGIDPGSIKTGYGVIQARAQSYKYLTSGVVRTTGSDIPSRLFEIFSGITKIIEQFQPTETAIEQIFMHRNASSALKLGQARGVAIVAMSAHHLPVAEYAARQIKQSVVGYGAAQKEQVQHMVMKLLLLQQTPQEDAADALAVALCHANVLSTNRILGEYV